MEDSWTQKTLNKYVIPNRVRNLLKILQHFVFRNDSTDRGSEYKNFVENRLYGDNACIAV